MGLISTPDIAKRNISPPPLTIGLEDAHAERIGAVDEPSGKRGGTTHDGLTGTMVAYALVYALLRHSQHLR